MINKFRTKSVLIILLVAIIFMVAGESVSAAYYVVERGQGPNTSSISMSLGNAVSASTPLETESFYYKYILSNSTDYQKDIDVKDAAYILEFKEIKKNPSSLEVFETQKYTEYQRKMISAIISKSTELINTVPDNFNTDDVPAAAGYITNKSKNGMRLNDYRYYCAQIAIEVYLYNRGMGQGSNNLNLYLWENSVTIADVNKLIASAEKSIAAESENFSIIVNNNVLNFSLTNDNIENKYFVSDLFEVEGDLSNYTVKAESWDGKNDAKIKIVDSEGSEKTTFKAGEKYRVLIPAEGIVSGLSTFKITVNATKEYNVYKEAKIYTTGNEMYQDLAEMGEIEKKEKADSAFFKISVDKEPIVEVTKLDATAKRPLAGATLKILDKDKKEISCTIVEEDGKEKELDVCSWVSGENTVSIKNLPIGKYYLTETKAPKGYLISKEAVSFVVTEKSYIVPVEMINQLEVEVPDTLGEKSALFLSIAMFDIALGIGIVIYVKKNKVQE